MLVVDLDTLQQVDLLDLVNEVFLKFLLTQDMENVVGIG